MEGAESEDEEEEEEYENYAAMTQGRKKQGKVAETEELALSLRGGTVGYVFHTLSMHMICCV